MNLPKNIQAGLNHLFQALDLFVSQNLYGLVKVIESASDFIALLSSMSSLSRIKHLYQLIIVLQAL
jgi:hypothetical protein